MNTQDRPWFLYQASSRWSQLFDCGSMTKCPSGKTRSKSISNVTIYTKPGCPYCAAAKDDLQRRGLRYTEHNVKADQVALRRMLELNGNQRRVPTIVQGDQVSVGFSGY